VEALRQGYQVSERRACRTAGCAQATDRARSCRDPKTALRQRIRELAQARVRDGARKIRVLLNREGWAVGQTLGSRRYREEGLPLRHRVPRRRKAVAPRGRRPMPRKPNEAWTLDFVADPVADGRRFRALTVLDVFTRESLAIEVGAHLRGEHVVAVLNQLTGHRGAPQVLRCDNGSEFCSQIVDLWAAHHNVSIEFSRPGKPTEHAHVESFNGTCRKECLNAHWFDSLQEAKGLIEAWRREYNESRPHRALQDRTPVEFARAIGADGGPEGRKTAGDSP